MDQRVPAERPDREPIAIIGIGCRYPGGVDSPARFWDVLRDGVDAVGEIPIERFPSDHPFHGTEGPSGQRIPRMGGFLDDIDRFDAAAFGISPREVEQMDPQQRILLETVWEALDDAGLPQDRLAGSRAGVYIGVWLNDYEASLYSAIDDVELYTTTGGGRYPVAGRVSFAFDFRGPSLTVDTACSSSLVAIHLAVQALRSGETDLSLAGGVNVILQPQISLAYSRSGMLAPDGRCKFGDARADGYVRSEGCGVVVLKRLGDALADSDPIYALIRGSTVNNDGQGSGLLVQPSTEGQMEMLRAAYADAGIDPATVSYVEAHGTGTLAGDPVEIQAIGTVLGENRRGGNPCLISSVKTNFGHTEGAAGVAGLIKVALALKHGAIPRSLHFSAPSPRIAWDELPVAIPSALTPWPENGTRRYAGINSFGITGTNAHVVLEAAPPASTNETAQPDDDVPVLLPLSAHSHAALANVANGLADFIETKGPRLTDLVYTAGNRRTHLPERLAIVAGGQAELIETLRGYARGEHAPGLTAARAADEAPRVVFVFPGQGSQWEGMARELLVREPEFRSALEQCDAAIRAETGWSVISELTAAPGEHRLEEIDVVQPLLFAVQVALARLWTSWGIPPAAVVGHSMGEIAAAHIAGALSLEDAAAIICRRSRLLRQIRGQGAMALVELSVDEAREAISGYEDVLSIGVSNGPRSTVLSGDPAALDQVLGLLQAKDVFCRPVKVDVASHSPQVEPLLADLLETLAHLSPVAGSTPIYSTVLVEPVDGPSLDAEYWGKNLRQPVMFAGTVQRLLDDGMTAFIEISPHPILLPSVQQAIQATGRPGMALPSLRRGEPERATLLGSLGALYTQGAQVDWPALAPLGRHLHLPPYPWQRERFWYEDAASASGGRSSRSGGHPLLGHAFTPAGQTGMATWETALDLRRQPYFVDHKVGGAVVAPATAIVELILSAASETFAAEALAIEDLEIHEALILPSDRERPVQVATERRGDMLDVRVFAGDIAPNTEITWSLCAEASVKRLPPQDAVRTEQPALIQARCGVAIPSDEHYAAMAGRGLDYGPAFQTVDRTWRGQAELLGALRPLGEGGQRGHAGRITLFDGALQLAIPALPDGRPGTYVPVAIRRLQVNSSPQPGQTIWAHVIVPPDAEDVTGAFTVDLKVLDDDGCVLVDVAGMQLAGIEHAEQVTLDNWLYEINWHEQSRPANEERADGNWLILGPDSLAQAVASQLERCGGNCVIVTPGDATRQISSGHFELNRAQPEDLTRVLSDAYSTASPPRGVIFAWSVDSSDTTQSALERAESTAWAAVGLMQAISGAGWQETPQLWLVTRSAQPVGSDLVDACQGVVWGIGRTIANEHPEFQCKLIDLSIDTGAAGLLTEILTESDETHVALRGAKRYVARLEPHAPNREAGKGQRRPRHAGEPYRLEVGRRGILDTIGARPAARRAPGRGEVEIQVAAAGINFIDVMKAMGIYPGLEPRPDTALGGECAGVVVAVGPSVTDLAVGDPVVAVTPSFTEAGCLAAYLTVPAELVARRPEHLSEVEAAGQPLVYMTAYCALEELGRIRAGDRVLIHSATGGVGMAALEVARRAGAEVFATAGNPEKRAYLRRLGIEHVYDSRTLDFAAEVLADTEGRGVDIVLNSLAGDAMEASLRVLAPRGRFVEIGKRDIYEDRRIGLAPFQKNISYVSLDLARMVEVDRAEASTLLRTVIQLLETRELPPLPVTSYPAAEAREAFRVMAGAGHTGKLVIRLGDEPVEITAGGSLTIRRDATYLITGGLGALGLETARWLASQGAGAVALMGRGEPSPAASEAVSKLDASGTRVLVLKGDVTDPDDVGSALAKIDAVLPPLRGIFHAAGVLADATLLQFDRRRLAAALGPKVAGAWNLHSQTAGRPLDCFVLFSSVASILGMSGQANYAAANAYLDGLAHQRQAAGLPATSINWAPWAGIGLAAADANRGDRLETQGMESVELARGLVAMETLLDQDAPEVAVMRLNLERWASTNPGATAPFLQALREDAAGESAPAGLVEGLMAAAPDRRLPMLEDFVRDRLAEVLRLAPERLAPTTPFKSFGLDSLMALELRNRLEAGSGLSLTATLAWNYPTIAALAEHLLVRLDIPTTTTTPVAEVNGSPAEPDDLETLSQDEVALLLKDEMDAIAKLLGAD